MIKKKDRRPIVVETNKRKILNSWWAKSWIDNLNSYADFENRLARGRSYVRSGAVIHLDIDRGHIYSLVKGSRRTPYEVNINISVIDDNKRQEIEKLFQNNFTSMEELIRGEFPKELKGALLEREYGFFPGPNEIKVDCSCPDWAVMCKHVVATLYAVAIRLDTDPLLFLELRGLDSKKMLSQSAEDKVRDMVQRGSIKSSRIIPKERIPEIFNI